MCGFLWSLTFTFCAGYQFDYVFDWTILKYPQIGSTSRLRVSGVNVFYSNMHLLFHNLLFSSLVSLFRLLGELVHLVKRWKSLQVCIFITKDSDGLRTMKTELLSAYNFSYILCSLDQVAQSLGILLSEIACLLGF